MLKTARILYTQSGTTSRENGTVPNLSQPIMAKTDCDVVHCPTVGNKHWMFDTRLANILINLRIFPFGGTRDSILTNIDCKSHTIPYEFENDVVLSINRLGNYYYYYYYYYYMYYHYLFIYY